jgi:type II secretion system protein F
MAKFNYTARDRKGARIEGALEVEDRQAVIARLQTMGYFPVRIVEVTPAKRFRLSLSAARGRVSQSELVSFNRQLADLVASGVPLVKSLGIILNQMRDERLREVIGEVSKSVQGGDTLAQAIQRHPKVFDSLAVALVRAGEAGGMLDQVLMRLADFSEKEAELRGKVISSLIYPAVMVGAGTVVIAILLTVVVPRITSVYANVGQALPGITLLLIAITNFLTSYWWIALGGAAALVVGMRQFLKTQEGRFYYHSVLFRVPILGEIIHKRELSLFSRTLGNLLRNGVPILQALDITQSVVNNAVVLRDVQKLPPAISQGSSMASIMGESKIFPDAMVSMVAVGEETAQVDTVLVRIADAYEREVDRSLKTLTSMLEPAIILCLGVVVMFVVIAMLLPILMLDPTAGE